MTQLFPFSILIGLQIKALTRIEVVGNGDRQTRNWKTKAKFWLFNPFFFFSSSLAQQQKEQIEGEQQRWELNGKLNLKNRKHGEFPEQKIKQQQARPAHDDETLSRPRLVNFQICCLCLNSEMEKACGLRRSAPNHQNSEAPSFQSGRKKLPREGSVWWMHFPRCNVLVSWAQQTFKDSSWKNRAHNLGNNHL